jgi:hypothetical protein
MRVLLYVSATDGAQGTPQLSSLVLDPSSMMSCFANDVLEYVATPYAEPVVNLICLVLEVGDLVVGRTGCQVALI